MAKYLGNRNHLKHSITENAAGRRLVEGASCISLLERPKSDVLIVRWSDPCRCHYAEQTWRLSAAKSRGRCALSGNAIHKGDPVFTPGMRLLPLNAGEMILQCEVPESIDVGD